MIGLLQKSEPEGVAAMDLAAAAIGSWLSMKLLDSLMWSGGRLARVDSVDVAASCGLGICLL